MAYGYNGRILKIDLSRQDTEVIEPDDLFYRKYFGGACLGAYFLLKELEPKIDPLSEHNILIFSTSPITGVECPGTAMHNVITKSPLTNSVGESTTPGHLGAQIKKAGFDAILIKGKSEKPCYIRVNDNEVRICDASGIWGRTTSKAYDFLTKKENNLGYSIALIGPAGENLVRYASIVTDNCFLSSRCGVGAVMGSKNLKALCVKGNGKIKVADPKRLEALSVYFKNKFLQNPLNKSQFEPASNAGYLKAISDQGMLSAKNFHFSYFKNSEKIDGFTITKKHQTVNVNCTNCYGGCKKRIDSLKDVGLNPDFGLVELESLAATAYNLLIGDMDIALKIWDLICDYGFDGTSLGNVLGYAVECFESGIITGKDTGGIKLSWGDGDSILKIIGLIAARKGIGDLLAEGVKLASEKIKGSKDLAMHVKGMEIPFHEPRIKQMLGLGYAVSPTGPYYTVVEHDTDFDFNADQLFMDKVSPLTVYERLELESLSEKKVRMFYLLQPVFSMLDAVCGCIFAFSPVRFFNFEHLVEIVNSATGWESSLFELVKIGEKRINMYKLFALREGIEKDCLPPRFFEPIENGPKKGARLNKQELDNAIQLYYRLAGWNKKGRPTFEKLLELDLLEF